MAERSKARVALGHSHLYHVLQKTKQTSMPIMQFRRLGDGKLMSDSRQEMKIHALIIIQEKSIASTSPALGGSGEQACSSDRNHQTSPTALRHHIFAKDRTPSHENAYQLHAKHSVDPVLPFQFFQILLSLCEVLFRLSHLLGLVI